MLSAQRGSTMVPGYHCWSTLRAVTTALAKLSETGMLCSVRTEWISLAAHGTSHRIPPTTTCHSTRTARGEDVAVCAIVHGVVDAGLSTKDSHHSTVACQYYHRESDRPRSLEDTCAPPWFLEDACATPWFLEDACAPTVVSGRRLCPTMVPGRRLCPTMLPGRRMWPTMVCGRRLCPAMVSGRRMYHTMASGRRMYPTMMSGRRMCIPPPPPPPISAPFR